MRRLRATIDDRPECMEMLGLLPPYSTRDVKQAYRNKIRQAHPDAGGDAARFIEVREAYERALDFCRFRDSRRGWIGENVEKYMSRRQVIEAIEICGGSVELQSEQSFLRTYGPDFADVLRKLVVVELSGSDVDDGSLSCLASGGDVLSEVRLLVLSGSRITDDGLESLSGLDGLRFLDLSRTTITSHGLDRFGGLPNLEWIHLGRTRVGFFARRRLTRAPETRRRHPAGCDRTPGRPGLVSAAALDSRLLLAPAGWLQVPPLTGSIPPSPIGDD